MTKIPHEKQVGKTIASCFLDDIPKMALVSKLTRHPRGACEATDL